MLQGLGLQLHRAQRGLLATLARQVRGIDAAALRSLADGPPDTAGPGLGVSPPARPCLQLSSLVLAEQKAGALQPNTLSAVSAARALGGPVTVLVAGHQVAGAAEAASKVAGVDKVRPRSGH